MGQEDGLPTRVSPREVQILRLISKGRTTAEIASALGITQRTVKWHVANIFRKLGVRTRAEAVAVAARRGLLDDGREP